MENLILKLLLAALVGGLIGAERELRTGIGLRTMMLISLCGARSMTMASSESFLPELIITARIWRALMMPSPVVA